MNSVEKRKALRKAKTKMEQNYIWSKNKELDMTKFPFVEKP